MRAKPSAPVVVQDLFRHALVGIIDLRYELVRLAELNEWSVFDREFGAQFAYSNSNGST